MKTGCLKYVSIPTSGSLDLLQSMVMLLFLSSRQFASFLLEHEAGFAGES